jgi:hypothetical protein
MHHGEEEKGQEEIEVVAPASYWGNATNFGFREISISPSGWTDVRPLLLLVRGYDRT